MTMKVIALEPDKKAYVKELEHELEEMQKYVGGYIEVIYPFPDDNVAFVCNEEGKLQRLPINRTLKTSYTDDVITGGVYDFLAGNVFIVGLNDEDGEFCSLTDEQISKYLDLFMYPETIVKIAGDYYAMKVYGVEEGIDRGSIE